MLELRGIALSTILLLVALSFAGCECRGMSCSGEITTSPQIQAGRQELRPIRQVRGIYDGFTGSPNHDQLGENYFIVEVDNFSGFEATQQRPEWCWAAAVSMTMNYQGIPLSQCDVVESLGGECDSSELQFGSISSIISALNGIQGNRLGRPALVQATSLSTGNGTPLIADLATNWPPIVGLSGEDEDAPGHVYVLLTIRYSWYPNAWNVPVFWNVELYDPWLGETVRMSGLEFARRIDFAVRMRVGHG